MNKFKDGGFKKRGNDFGGRPKFEGNRGGNNRSGGERNYGQKSGGRSVETFKAECSKCHNACTLPFRPSGDRPVFCSDCFAKNSPDNDRREGRHADRGRRNDYGAPREQRAPLNNRPNVQSSKEMVDIKQQLSTIEARLNRILDIINPPTAAVKNVAKETMATVPVVVKKAAIQSAKKAVDTAEVRKAVEKAVAKKAPAKVVSKAVKKVAPAKKAVAKKVVAKTTKKVAKKSTKSK